MCNASNTNDDTYKYVKEYQDFKETKPCWHSFAFPILALLIIGLLLFIPIICKCHCECDWQIFVYLILAAIVLLLVIVFLMKLLSSYWVKIVEINDKQKDRLERLAQERIEREQLSEKTQNSLIERLAKTAMDEDVKDGDNERKIAIMEKEYQSHLADVALEMVKSSNQITDQQLINQIVQSLLNK